MFAFALDYKYVLYYLTFLAILILFTYCYVLCYRFFSSKAKQESKAAACPAANALNTSTTPVDINVGGTHYTSSLQTLTKCPSSRLANMFNGTEPIDVDETKQCYFLDRDGKMFRHVLNFLRNAELILPESFSESALLLKEASFFQIDELCAALTEKLSSGAEKVKSKASDEDKQCQVMMSSVGVGGDIQAQENVRKTTKEQFESKDENRNENDDKKSEKKSKYLEEGPKREESLLPNNLPQFVLSENKLSPSSDIVCVLTDSKGAVLELWYSDNEFTIEFPDDDSYFPLNTTHKFSGKDFVPSKAIVAFGGDRFCRRCLARTNTNDNKLGFCRFCYKFLKWDVMRNNRQFEQIHIQLSWIAKYLFMKDYKLLSSCSFDSHQHGSKNFNETVLYHCFVH